MTVEKGECRPGNRCKGHLDDEPARDQFNMGYEGWCINTHERVTNRELVQPMFAILFVLGILLTGCLLEWYQ